MIGAVFTLLATPMYNGLGIHLAGSVVATLSAHFSNIGAIPVLMDTQAQYLQLRHFYYIDMGLSCDKTLRLRGKWLARNLRRQMFKVQSV